ncbi:MAG: oligosaccharide flippase family protein [Anaerolineae bacterium]|nr:oligosaccharide flippase family protein [Anaerolineae bacterium]
MNSTKEIHRTRHLFAGVLSDYGLVVVNTILAFALAPLMVQGLGPAAFGLWATISSVLNYIGLFDAGLSNAMPRFVAFHQAHDGDEGVARVIASGFVLYGGVSFCVLVAVLVTGQFLGNLVDLETLSESEGTVALTIAGGALALQFLLNPYKGAVFGTDRLHVVNISLVVYHILRAGFTLVALRLQGGVVGFALATLVSTVMLALILGLYVHRALPRYSLKLRFYDGKLARELLGYGSVVMLVGISMQIILNADNLIIGRLLGVSTVASYAIALQLIEMARQVVLRLGRVLVPVYARYDATGQRQLSGRVYLEVAKISVGIGTVLTLSLALIGGHFIEWWVGAAHFVGWTTLRALAVFVLIQSIVAPSQVALLSANRHRTVAWFRGSEAILKLALSVLLVPYLGVNGVALGTVAAAVLTSLWGLPRAVLREFGVPPLQYLQQAILPHVVLGAVTCMGVLWIQSRWTPDGLVELLLVGISITLFYGIGYWVIFLDRKQHGMYRNMAKEILWRKGTGI